MDKDKDKKEEVRKKNVKGKKQMSRAEQSDQLVKYDESVSRYKRASNLIKVVDDDTLGRAAAFVKNVRTEMNAIENDRKEMVAPFNRGVKAINEKAKVLMQPLRGIISVVSLKMGDYQDERRRAQMIKEKKQKQADERAAQRLEKQGRDAEAEGVREVSKRREPEPETVRGRTATATIVKRWVFDVDDLKNVPIEYLQINEKAVNVMIRKGVREIPGLKIFQTRQTLVR